MAPTPRTCLLQAGLVCEQCPHTPGNFGKSSHVATPSGLLLHIDGLVDINAILFLKSRPKTQKIFDKPVFSDSTCRMQMIIAAKKKQRADASIPFVVLAAPGESLLADRRRRSLVAEWS